MPFGSDPRELFGGDDRRREALIESFEEACFAGAAPDIESYLAGWDGDRLSLLQELAQAEFEFRLKRGEAARVEEYLQRFEELAAVSDRVVELIVGECQLRRRIEPLLSIDEYYRRFPALSESLAGCRDFRQLFAAAAGLGAEGGAGIELEVVGGPAKGRRHTVTEWGTLVIGRGREAGWVLDADPHLSRRHCQLVCKAGDVWLVDLESHNGTGVNERQVQRTVLQHGDLISMGTTRVVVLVRNGGLHRERRGAGMAARSH